MTQKPNRKRKTKEVALTDKERILMTIVERLATTQMLGPAMRGGNGYSSDAYQDNVHFAYWDKPKPGDLVLARTGHVGRWKIGFYERAISGGAMIRAIGENTLCTYTNESFIPIKGLTEHELLEGERYTFTQKVLKAFAKGDKYMYRFGGIDFEADIARVWIREVFGGLGQKSEPFYAAIAWKGKITIKSILNQMCEAGYGTRSFRSENENKTESNE